MSHTQEGHETQERYIRHHSREPAFVSLKTVCGLRRRAAGLGFSALWLLFLGIIIKE